MNSRNPLDSHRPCSIGGTLARQAFASGKHGCTAAVADALQCSPDTASRILSSRKDARDPTLAETGALLELLGTHDALAVLAAAAGARVVYPPAGPVVDLATAPMAVMGDAATFMQALVKAIADGTIDDGEWAALLPMLDGLHAGIDRVVAAAAAKRVRA